MKKHSKKLIAGALLFMVFIGVIVYVRQLMNSPSTGEVMLNTSEPVTKNQTTEPKVFKNQFFTTTYPARYELNSNKNASSSLASWLLIAHQSIGGLVSSKIAVMVDVLPSGGIAETSAMHNFTAHPELYTIKKVVIGGEQATIAEETKNGYERTLLWPHSAHLLTISMSAGQKNDGLVEEFDVITNNMLWSL